VASTRWTPRRRSILLIVGLAIVLLGVVLLATRPEPLPMIQAFGPGAVVHDGGVTLAPALPKPRRGDGQHALSGLVVDGAGAPVAGAHVIAEPEDIGGREPGAAGVDAGAVALVVAVSDETGAFQLEGLRAGRHRLRVEGPSLFTAEVRFVPVPSDDLRIVVARQVRIDGRVVDGGPVAGAVVEVVGDALGGRLAVTTASDGAFAFDALPEGTYQVWATRGDLAARAQRVPRLGGGPFGTVELRLEPATIVIGRVVDGDRRQGVVADVEIRPVPGGGADDEPARLARSAADGVFRIEGVPDGRWIADGWAPGWVAVGGVEFDAGRGVPEVELARGGIVEGTVVDGSGRPVAGAQVAAFATGADGQGLEASAGAEERAAARHAGRLTGLGDAACDGPRPGAECARSADPTFIARGELGVLVGPIPRLPPVGAPSLRYARIVDDPLTAPLGAPVNGRVGGPPLGAPPPLPVEPALAPTWTTGADGHFRVTGLTAATWTLSASAPALAEGRSRPLRVALGGLERGVTIVLGAGVVVVGTVTDEDGPVAGAAIELRSRGKGPALPRAETVTAPDGSYRLGPFSGEVTLRVSAYGHGDLERDLDLGAPGGATAPGERREDVVLAAADAELAGVVEDPSGLPARGARVAIRAGAASGRRTIAGDGGRFAIPYVPAGSHPLRVEHPDYPPLETEAATGAPARLRLAYGGGIEGLVLDHHTGAPLAGIAVAATGPGNDRRSVATGQRGELRLSPLAPGRWTVRIAIPGYLAVQRAVDVAAGDGPGAATVRDLRFELERGAFLGGTVRDRFGSRVPGVKVAVSRRGESEVAAETRTDADGVFRLRDVPTGELVIMATKDDLRGHGTANLRAGDEFLSLELEVR
jgi:hypothetical protein